MRTTPTILLLLLPWLSQAQVNAYAQVLSISDNTLSIGISNEVHGQFQVGGKAIVIQMQDDVIGTTTNNSSFGDLGNIQRAGMYVVANVTGIGRSGDALSSLTLSQHPHLNFNLGANSSVQVVSFERLGDGDHTSTGNISALPWNGSIGGVVAIDVQGNFTLAHTISANGAGFRGGAADQTVSTTCDGDTWRAEKTNRYAFKGEGIYKISNTAYASGKGRILNGGGGGNDHNGGGGGGGNFTSGGLAGPGYNCSGILAGGNGGLELSGHIFGGRVFMGGGGGGGEGNDNVATNGGNGGGIIFIRASQLRTSGSCLAVISANGSSASNSGNDGAGGGGGGGSIVIQAGSIIAESGCPLTIQANGGNGGNVATGTPHGGGGGGGQGTIWFSAGAPSGSTTVQTNNGTGGCNTNANPCTSRAAGGGGTSGMGIFNGASTPMPVELLSFNAEPMEGRVLLRWVTATETNNEFFAVERSSDGAYWSTVLTIPGKGNSHTRQEYQDLDVSPLNGVSYYRLKQQDGDGHSSLSPVVAVDMKELNAVLMMAPNPASSSTRLVLGEEKAMIQLYDGTGRTVLSRSHQGGTLDLDVSRLPAGVYTLVVEQEGATRRGRLVRQ